MQTPKITHLPNEILENIFKFLDIESLFNIASCNGWLRPAARTIFVRKYNNNKISLEDRPLSLITNTQSDTLVISNFKLCLQFLRCFGCLITNLEIMYSDLYPFAWHNEILNEYIQEYCSHNLTEISLIGHWHSIWRLSKPFQNVRSVRFERCNLLGQLSRLIEWFPSICRLELLCNQINQGVAEYFSELEYLYCKYIRCKYFDDL